MVLKKIIKNVLSTNAVSSLLKGRKFIFLYHDISGKDSAVHSGYYSTTLPRFYEQMDFLGSLFNFVPLDELVSSAHPSSKNMASLVFDDGFHSVFEHAFPFLSERKIPFSIFVNKNAVLHDRLWVTDLVLKQKNKEYLEAFYSLNPSLQKISFGNFCKDPFYHSLESVDFNQFKNPASPVPAGKNTFCSLNELKAMQDSGLVSISSHSASHFVLSRCSEDLLEKEIRQNLEFVQTNFGPGKDLHFAIPFGNKRHYGDEVIAACGRAGYRFIYTTNPNSFTDADIQPGVNLIPRIPVYDQDVKELRFLVNRTLLKKFDF